MMNMMSSIGFSGIGFGMFWLHLHWFFGAFAIVGFIFLVVWGLKHLNAHNLKSVAMGLLTIGIVGSLLTAPLAAFDLKSVMSVWGNRYNMNGIGGPMMMNMMNKMMDHDEGVGGEDHDEHEEMQEMLRSMKAIYRGT